MPGCGALTAAKIVGETAGVTRFSSEACFARHAGVAPIPVWSGNTAGRVRMTRAGNRQLNAALHRIAVTQIRLDGDRPPLLPQTPTAEATPPPRPSVASNAASPASSTEPCTPDHNATTGLQPAAA